MTIKGYQILAYEWMWFAVMTIMVFARLYVRVYMIGSPLSRDSWRWSDLFIVMSWLLRVPIVIGDCFVNAWDGYRVDYDAVTSDSDLIKKNKVDFVLQLFYMLVFISIKLAMLCLFAEFVPKALKKVWIYIRIITAIVAMHGTATVLVYFTWCRPLNTMWDQPNPTCNVTATGLEIWFAGHIVTDLLIISVPFTIISLLKNLTFSQRIVGGFMFSLGFIAVACAFANCIILATMLMGTTMPTTRQLTASNMVSITEPPLAICIACLPPLRLLFTRSGREKLFGSPKHSAAESDTIVEGADLEASRMTKSTVGKEEEEKEAGIGSSGKKELMIGQRIIQQM